MAPAFSTRKGKGLTTQMEADSATAATATTGAEIEKVTKRDVLEKDAVPEFTRHPRSYEERDDIIVKAEAEDRNYQWEIDEIFDGAGERLTLITIKVYPRDVNVIWEDETTRKPEAAGKADPLAIELDGSNRYMWDFWQTLRPLHPRDCPCLECEFRRRPLNEEETEELEKLRKTVTVATRSHLPEDLQGDLYVGIGITRADLLSQFPDYHVIDAAIRVVPESGASPVAGDATEDTPTTGPSGTTLMGLFRSGCIIGYDPTQGCYLVGKFGDILASGAILPKKTYVARENASPASWLELDRINYELAAEAAKKGKNMPNKKNAEGEGTTAVAKAPKEKTPCACGCGLTTLSNFAMGHDSKLRGIIHRVLEGREDLESIPMIAYEKLNKVVAQRYNPDTNSLEDVEVPECHFSHDKGKKAMVEAADKAEKAAAAAAAKAEKEAKAALEKGEAKAEADAAPDA